MGDSCEHNRVVDVQGFLQYFEGIHKPGISMLFFFPFFSVSFPPYPVSCTRRKWQTASTPMVRGLQQEKTEVTEKDYLGRQGSIHRALYRTLLL